MAPISFNPARSLPDEYTPKKVALAYSGGLDTSCIIPWLKERYDCEVIAVAADLGQPDDLAGVEAKALASGASKCYVLDLRQAFLTDYVYPTMRAGAMDDPKHLLGPSMAWPVIAKHQVEIAQLEGCDALAHGRTGQGDDEVRFELTYQALAPMLRVIAPWRVWDIRSREDAIAYAEAHGVPATRTSISAIDGNLWHRTHVVGLFEELWPEEPASVTISFERGTPVALNGQGLEPVELVVALNEMGGAHGMGRVDLLDHRPVRMKSGGLYESPVGTLLLTAHRELERATLDKATIRLKDLLAQIYADVVYNGQWFSPLREALDAFVTKTQEPVTGDVRLKLDNGNCAAVGRRSPFSRYDEDPATVGADDVCEQADAEGFMRLFGLGQKDAVQRSRRLQEQDVELVK